MEILTWRQVDFAGIVLAGLVAGYVMALAGLWAGTLPGLVAIDSADFGRRYMMSDRHVGNAPLGETPEEFADLLIW